MYKSRSSVTHTTSLSHTDHTPTHDTLTFAAMAKKHHELITLAMMNSVVGGELFNPAQRVSMFLFLASIKSHLNPPQSQIAAIISKNGKDTSPPKKCKKAVATTNSNSASGTKQSKKTKASSAQDDKPPTMFMIALVVKTSVVWSGNFERVNTHECV